jgi:hypothetical protein
MKQSQKLFVGVGLALAAFLGYVPEALLALPFVVGDTATTDDYTELMKIVFDDTVIMETVYDTELMDFMPEGEVKQGPEGRWFETSQLYQSPGSWGSRTQNDYIPQANAAKAENGRVTLKKVVGSLEETAEVLKKIKRDKAAFITWSDEQFPLFKEGLVDELDRQLVGDGSGIRARVNEGVISNPVVVGSTLGIAGFDHELMQFRRGLRLRASPNIDGTAPRATAYVVDQVDWDNNALTLDTVADLVDGDYLFEGDAASNSAGKDVMGLLGLIDDGGIVQTLQNIDRNVHLWFRSYVRDLNGADLTEFATLQTDRQSRHRGGGMVDMIVMSDEAFDAVWIEIRDDRVVNDPRSYAIGRKGILMYFGGTRQVTFRTARKLPSTLVFGIDSKQLRKFILHEFQWDDTTGSLWRQVTDATGVKDAFFAYGTAHMEIAIKSAQRCWRLEGFTSPAESIPAESV